LTSDKFRSEDWHTSSIHRVIDDEPKNVHLQPFAWSMKDIGGNCLALIEVYQASYLLASSSSTVVVGM